MPNLFAQMTMGEKQGAPVYRMFINGQWVEADGGEVFEIICPQDGKVVTYGAKATLNNASQAVEAAFLARKKMEFLSPVKRSEILSRAALLFQAHQDEVIKRVVLETGKPITEAHHEVTAAIKRLQYATEEAKSIKGETIPGGTISDSGVKQTAILTRKPLGVILGITPFNYPCFIPMSKIAPALASGNTIVIKPASSNPTPVLYIARFLQEAGLPDGAINIITGGGADIGDYLSSHPKINMISFTGSSKVGNRIAQLAGKVQLHLELGGKCPALVSQKADIDLAAKECVKGALKFSGQRCDALSRFLVEEKVYTRFVEKAITEVKKWKVGDIWSEETQIGPLINENALIKILDLIDDAVAKGARIAYGKEIEKESLLMSPVVLTGVTTKMRIAWEETFGPALAIIKVKDFNEAISIANMSEYGLDSSVFTQDIDEAMYAANQLESGTVQINAAPAHGLGNFPFGGDEESGMGREGIGYSVYDMTKVHSIVFNPKK